jgi:hypothetical protein
MSAVAIYHRHGDLIVVPQGGGGGHFIDVEPIEILPPNDASALQAAIERALQTSAANADNDAPPKGWKTPLLKRVGVKSYKDLMKGASVCFIFEDANIFDIERWQPARDGRGFEPAAGRSERLTDANRLAESVLRALDVA